MTSTPLSEHPPKSLSESWATLSASDVHSEDGARSEPTDAGSFIDQTGPDDVASLDERYTSSEVDGNDEGGFDGDGYDSKSNVSESQELPAIFPQIGTSIDDSNITAKTAFRQPTESIEFIEPEEWPEVERVELKHTIRVVEGAEAAELQNQLPFSLQDSILTATVQQTTTKRSLETDKPFRVLYIGSPEFRNIILDKIGDVLVSSTCNGFETSSAESSRYHVVPTSYGTGAIPNFAELLPIHFQLVVDECPGAVSDGRTDKPNTITLNLKNRPSCTSFWTGNEYCISSLSEWAVPDVAIIFVSSADTPAVMDTQKLARIVMERHNVPTMVISEQPLWKMAREAIPLNHQSLHMCLETRHLITGKTAVVRRYPIDLKTFESITPHQLNRNLASLASSYPNKSSRVAAENSKLARKRLFFDTRKYARHVSPLFYLSDRYDLTLVLRLLLVTLVSAVSITVGLSLLRVTIIFLSQFLARSAISNGLEKPAMSMSPATSITRIDGLKQTSLSVLHSSTGDVQTLGDQHSTRGRLEDMISETALPSKQGDKSSGFEIQVVGDCHLIIKPPNKTLTSKKQPKFSVQVSRRDKVLDYEISRLFEEVYTLKLDRGDAYGIVNVTISTGTKPPINETISVDLGTPWLKIANWKRAAQVIRSQLMREFSIAQNGLSEAYGRLCTDLQVLMGDVVKKAHVLRHEANDLRRNPMGLSLESRDVVLSKSRQLSEVVRRTAIQPFLAASSVLQDHTKKVNREAKELMIGTWKKISTHAHEFDVITWVDYVRNLRKCKTLDNAQRRAKGLMRRRKCRRSECGR
ncbi:uncharacterized protein ATNIH1004_001464 [Aspergillus tanneri]|nr:uncharacterized protein ATNIH1004_001464 [Aspergillus tanneri]KAA8652559.1 hypothetical protein ATNIH1004_001464 [Aspergillus tanneri]